MKTPLLATTVVAITALAIYFYPSLEAKPGKTPTIQPPVVTTNVTNPSIITPIVQNQKKIEVAFVLDTTGSMSGLIQGAKDNIWSIASSMASAESAPIIKMGLVAYRDRGDDYVTKVADLSADLDTNYGTLMGFQAAGGGDHRESVNKALHDAVEKLSWSKDQDTYRVIFLVGDAPPQTKYQDEMQFPEIVKLAQSKGIIINTILCGSDKQTLSPWKQIANLGQGEFFQVTQSGNAVAIATPYDDQIASLSKQLDNTRLYYGDAHTKEMKRKKTAATELFNSEASAASIARKAEFNTSRSGAHNFTGGNELVNDVMTGQMDLSKIEREQLPEELQALKPEERTKVVEQKSATRKRLQQEIAKLSQQRHAYIKTELAESNADENSIDNRIYQTVRSQASAKGLVYSSDAPKY